jgi:hypothetical protein
MAVLSLRRLLAAVLVQAVLLCALAPQARAADALELQVKAAYLYKFASYVEWPEGAFPQPGSPVVLGIAYDNALADQLERMVAGRSVNGHGLVVRRLHRGDSLAGIHVLFVGAGGNGDLLAAARGQPVLTVTDTQDAFSQGSMINFLVAEDRLRFEIALKPASLARLRISARLLALATRVLTGAPS